MTKPEPKWSADARRVYTAAYGARLTLAAALGGNPHELRNRRPKQPWWRRNRDQAAILDAFFNLDMAIDSWAYRMGAEHEETGGAR